MADGRHLEFRFWVIIWTSFKIFGIVMDNRQPKTILWLNNEVFDNPTCPPSWIPSCSYNSVEDWDIAQNLVLGWQTMSREGMFKLAIRNKFNTAAAIILHFVFRCIIHSPMTTFYTKFHIVGGNRYPKWSICQNWYFMTQDGGWLQCWI